MASFIDDPHYWHLRAQQVRAQAQVIRNLNIGDVRSRHELLQIADAYDRIAENTRGRADS